MRTMQLARLALLADLHLHARGGEDAGETGARYARHLEKVTREMAAEHVDAILVAGDLTQHGEVAEYEEWQRWRERWEHLAAGAGIPVFCVPGNHDVGEKNHVSVERVARFEREAGPSFFAVDIAGVRLIGLNSLLLGSGLPREEEQWDFLRTELGQPAALPEPAPEIDPQPRPRIVLLHQPPFLVHPDEEGDDYWNIDPIPRRQLLELLQPGPGQAGVSLLLAGHLHRPARLTLGDMSCLVAPAVSFGLPRGQQPEGWGLVTIESDGSSGFQLREIRPGPEEQ